MMKRPILLLILVLAVPSVALAQSHLQKWMRINNMQHLVMNTGWQGEGATSSDVLSYYDGFVRENWISRGWHVTTKNWTDPSGQVHAAMHGGSSNIRVSPQEDVMPVPLDDEGNTIRRYFRNPPPQVFVDGIALSEPAPGAGGLRGDEVAPDKIPGNADVMIESIIRLPIGIDIHQRAFAYTEKGHDNYVIFDWTFTNTGNVDLDDEVELPDQVLEDVYFMRGGIIKPGNESIAMLSYYGARETDSLRVWYGYNEWRTNASYNDFGRPSLSNGHIQYPWYVGEGFLHVDTSVDDTTNNPAQPWMTAHGTAEQQWFKLAPRNATEEYRQEMYQIASQGWDSRFPVDIMTEADGAYPNTKHMPPMDEWAASKGFKAPQEVNYQWQPEFFSAIGPYTLKPGEDFRIVWATAIGTISPEKGWEVGQRWLAQDPSFTWDGADNLPPIANLVYAQSNPNPWDIAKDHWVATGKDSLFNAIWHAEKAVNNGYKIPSAPPAPAEFTVEGLPDHIQLTWNGSESEKSPQFAGYRIYRAQGNPGFIIRNGERMGLWQDAEGNFGRPVAEIQGSGTYEWSDETAEQGQAYYYYITAFDDGSSMMSATGEPQVLESGKYLTMTTQPAHLTRKPGNSLSDVRVVPNPFSRSAERLQFVGEPDKIMFMNLPPVCTIRIYTESGDLVKVLEHNNGSGDEPWGNIEAEHSVTETGQVIVSGLYLAYVETPEGEHTVVKFVVVR